MRAGAAGGSREVGVSAAPVHHRGVADAVALTHTGRKELLPHHQNPMEKPHIKRARRLVKLLADASSDLRLRLVVGSVRSCCSLTRARRGGWLAYG